MKNNEEKILDLLKNNKTINCKTIERKLNISERTVRYCIKNLRSKGFCIDSCSDGYAYISSDKALVNVINNNYKDIFLDKDKRTNYMIEKILFSSNGINVNVLANQVYISYSTIEKEIPLIKEKLKKYNLALKRNAKTLTIEGLEKDKRLIVSNMLNGNENDMMQKTADSLCSMCNISFDKLKSIVEKQLSINQIYASNYSLKSIIIHLIINLVRINVSGFELTYPLYEVNQEITTEYLCAKQIFKEINKCNQTPINKFEIQQLSFIIASKTSNEKNIKENKDIKNFVLQIINEINETYYVNLYDKDFIDFFTLHLSNAFFRAKNNVFSKNPFTNKIYIQNPVIYDIAIYIAQKIKKDFSFNFNRDEITFIALHVGAVIEKKTENANSIKAIMLVDNYYNYRDINTINSKLSNDCEVVAITSNVDEEMTDYYDFVINASSSNTTPNFCKSLKVNLFLEENDYKNIIDFANKIKKSKEKDEVASKLYSFFDDRLFEKEHYEQTPEKMISYLCRKFQRAGFADETYESTVLEREKATPTSFDNYVALPHSINYSTNKNAGAVIINKTPMKWGDFYVNVIILIGINNNMRGEFKTIYKELLKAFNTLENIYDLFSSNNTKEFVDQLLQVTTNK